METKPVEHRTSTTTELSPADKIETDRKPWTKPRRTFITTQSTSGKAFPNIAEITSYAGPS